jgi:hypothetical protein
MNMAFCATCGLAERVTGAHIAGHRTRVFKMSGGGSQAAMASLAALVYHVAEPLAPPHALESPQSIGQTYSPSQIMLPGLRRCIGARRLSHPRLQLSGHRARPRPCATPVYRHKSCRLPTARPARRLRRSVLFMLQLDRCMSVMLPPQLLPSRL